MKTQLLLGHVAHARHVPILHHFSYPFIMIADPIPQWGDPPDEPLLAHNHFNLLSIHNSDYLNVGVATLREKVNAVLQREGVTELAARTFLVTAPRFLGYVFNPVSFFVSEREDGTLHSLLVEVNNTFGEKHLYVLRPSSEQRSYPYTFRFEKEFFVSPFFDRSGNYELTLRSSLPSFSVDVRLLDGDRLKFGASLTSCAQPLTVGSLVMALVRYPATALLTMSRIHVQALQLYFRRRLAPYLKPPPLNAYTLRSCPSLVHRVRLLCVDLMKRARTDAPPPIFDGGKR